MTDEGIVGIPMDKVEMLNAMQGMAEATWRFYTELKEQGFKHDDAFRLTLAWVEGTISGATKA